MTKHYKNWKVTLGVIMSICALVATAVLLGPTPLSCAAEKVVIGQVPQWPYLVINSRVIQRALQENGYSVSIKDLGDLGPMYAGLAVGAIHVYADYWLPTLHISYREKYGDEKILPVGDIYGIDAPTAWGVPEFVMKEHGIRSIPDLHGKSDLFKGKIFGYEPGTGGTRYSLKALKEYGLDQEYKFITGTVPTMFAELWSGVKRHRPTIVVVWRPHPIFQQTPLHVLEDPKGVIPVNRVQIAVNTGFAKTHPEIKKFLENFRIPMDEMEAMMLENAEKKVPEKKIADRWYEKNKAKIETWWK